MGSSEKHDVGTVSRSPMSKGSNARVHASTSVSVSVVMSSMSVIVSMLLIFMSWSVLCCCQCLCVEVVMLVTAVLSFEDPKAGCFAVKLRIALFDGLSASVDIGLDVVGTVATRWPAAAIWL